MQGSIRCLLWWMPVPSVRCLPVLPSDDQARSNPTPGSATGHGAAREVDHHRHQQERRGCCGAEPLRLLPTRPLC